jgi:hypothetical protein
MFTEHMGSEVALPRPYSTVWDYNFLILMNAIFVLPFLQQEDITPSYRQPPFLCRPVFRQFLIFFVDYELDTLGRWLQT